MKCIKMLGLFAAAATALMVLAGSASATLTEAAGDPVDVGDHIHTVSGHVVIKIGDITITCASHTITEKVTSNGATTASGTVESLTFTSCGNHTIEVKKAGSLSIETTGANKGTVRSTGAEITVLTHSLFLGTRHCIAVTSNTDIGTITGGTTATMSMGSAPVPQAATDSLCGSDGEWTGKSTINTPDTLLID